MSDRYKKSNELLERAKKVIPTGTQTFSKSYMQFPTPNAPLYLDRGQGGRVWDVDGNEYVDLISGLLPVNLGYCDPDVDGAIQAQLKKGISFSLATELETELAERLIDLIPCAEMVRFGKNGTDATSAAIRLARAHTGRDHIIACGYHGWQDWYVGATVRNLGVPKAVQDLTTKLPYNDIEAIKQTIAQHKDNVAAIILEPVSATEPAEGYLAALRALTEEEGIVLIFDEIITGFRVHLGGAQAHYGVTPDLAAFGKAMGNGMPISALVGRADIMRLMEDVFYSGTFGGEALSIAASIAVIDKMKRENAVEKLWQMGGALANGVEALAAQHNVHDVISLSGLPPWKVLSFSDHENATKEEIKTRFMLEMLSQGVLMAAAHNVCFAHNQKDIDQVLAAYDHTLKTISTELSDQTLVANMNVKPIYPVFQIRG